MKKNYSKSPASAKQSSLKLRQPEASAGATPFIEVTRYRVFRRRRKILIITTVILMTTCLFGIKFKSMGNRFDHTLKELKKHTNKIAVDFPPEKIIIQSTIMFPKESKIKKIVIDNKITDKVQRTKKFHSLTIHYKNKTSYKIRKTSKNKKQALELIKKIKKILPQLKRKV